MLRFAPNPAPMQGTAAPQLLTRASRRCTVGVEQVRAAASLSHTILVRRDAMKLEWHKPEVVEEEVGIEVTSYSSAELDRS